MDDALKDIDLSIATDPYNAYAYRNKGIYYLRKNNSGNAIRLLEQAATMDTTVEQIYSYLTEAYVLNNEYEKACDAHRKAVQRHERATGKVIPFCK